MLVCPVAQAATLSVLVCVRRAGVLINPSPNRSGSWRSRRNLHSAVIFMMLLPQCLTSWMTPSIIKQTSNRLCTLGIADADCRITCVFKLSGVFALFVSPELPCYTADTYSTGSFLSLHHVCFEIPEVVSCPSLIHTTIFNSACVFCKFLENIRM